MRLKALTLGYVLNTHIMGVEYLEKFLRARKGRGFTFFRPGPLSRAKSEIFSKSKNFQIRNFFKSQLKKIKNRKIFEVENLSKSKFFKVVIFSK